MGRSLGEQTRQAQLVLGRSEQQPCAPATPPPGGGGQDRLDARVQGPKLSSAA